MQKIVKEYMDDVEKVFMQKCEASSRYIDSLY